MGGRLATAQPSLGKPVFAPFYHGSYGVLLLALSLDQMCLAPCCHGLGCSRGLWSRGGLETRKGPGQEDGWPPDVDAPL